MLASSRWNFPDRQQKAWHESNHWVLGRQFCFEVGNDLEALLLRSRAALSLIGVLLCWTIFRHSRALFGERGGALALVLAAVSPTLLAHSRLVTSDLCVSLFFLWAIGGWWDLLNRVTAGRLLRSVLATAGLFLSKYSAVLLAPMLLILIVVRIARRERVRPGAVAGLVLLHAVGGLLLVWAAYGLRYSALEESRAASDTFFEYTTLEEVTEEAGPVGAVVRWMAKARVLPEAYLYGLAHVAAKGKARRAFFRGEYSAEGWWDYFPYLLLVKTPAGTLGLMVLGLLALGARRHGAAGPARAASSVPWITLALVYAGFAFTSSLNIGHRHLLPLYPPLLILAGGAASFLQRRRRWLSATVAVLTIGAVASSLRAYPHYLAYFNELVDRGAPYRTLVDSNLDWGQDLPGLRAERESRAAGPAYLAYFGESEPEYYGLSLPRIPSTDVRGILAPLQPATYWVSATHLQAVYLRAPGPWNPLYERKFQEARRAIRTLRDAGPEALAERLRNRDERLFELLRWYDHLRASRLMAYLRTQEPVAHVGFSLWRFELSASQLRQALEEPVADTREGPVYRDRDVRELEAFDFLDAD